MKYVLANVDVNLVVFAFAYVFAVFMHGCACVRARKCGSVCLWVCVCVCVYTYVRTYVRTYVCMYVCMPLIQ